MINRHVLPWLGMPRLSAEIPYNQNHSNEAPDSSEKRRRWIHFGDPDYFDQLPPHLAHLQALKNIRLPLAHESFGIISLSYAADAEFDDELGKNEAVESTDGGEGNS